MANKNDKNNIKDESMEDTTMYGEFISSFHQWQTLDRQNKKAQFLEEITEELVAKKGTLRSRDDHDHGDTSQKG